MFHISRKSKLQLEVEETIIFDKGKPNNSLNSILFTLKQIKGLEKLVEFLRSFCIPIGFDIKELFDTWGTDNIDKALIPVIRKHRIEIIFEYVRQVFFPDKISRYEAFYLTEYHIDWIKPLEIVDDYILYEFESIDVRLERYYARWTELSKMSHDFDSIYQNAKNYWSNLKPEDDIRVEILAIGTFKVISKNTILINSASAD